VCSTGSGQGPVVSCCERGDETSDSGTTQFVIFISLKYDPCW
jgi:hypothetical protein